MIGVYRNPNATMIGDTARKAVQGLRTIIWAANPQNDTLDSFVQSPLLIAGEVVLRIHHNLMSRLDDVMLVRRVYSHQRAHFFGEVTRPHSILVAAVAAIG